MLIIFISFKIEGTASAGILLVGLSQSDSVSYERLPVLFIALIVLSGYRNRLSYQDTDLYVI